MKITREWIEKQIANDRYRLARHCRQQIDRHPPGSPRHDEHGAILQMMDERRGALLGLKIIQDEIDHMAAVEKAMEDEGRLAESSLVRLWHHRLQRAIEGKG